jgi:hypothetical protein
MPGPPVRNPYHFGSPAEKGHFCDRERELDTLQALMLNGQNAILIAPRRFGKTSLLNLVVERVRAAGGRTGRVNLMRCSTEQEIAEELMRGVLHGPAGWLRGNLAALTQKFRGFRIAPTFNIENGEVKSIQIAGASATTNWRDVIADAIRLLKDLGDERHPVSLIIDEYQRGVEISESLPSMTKALIDDLPAVSLVLAGSKRHLMEQISIDPERSPLYNIGQKIYLPQIPRADFVEYLVQRALESGKTLTPEEAGRIFEIANGVPNDVQLLAFFSWEAADRVIDAAAVNAATTQAVDSQKEEFRNIFEHLSRSQQRLIKLIARGGVVNVGGSQTINALGVSHTGAAKAGEYLQRQELIIRRGSEWALASGFLQAWLIAEVD